MSELFQASYEGYVVSWWHEEKGRFLFWKRYNYFLLAVVAEFAGAEPITIQVSQRDLQTAMKDRNIRMDVYSQNGQDWYLDKECQKYPLRR